MASIRTDLSTARRVYVQTRFGEACVERLKALGAHWDREARCWWVGAARRAEVEALLRDGGALDSRDPVERAARADQLEEQGRASEARAAREAKEDVSACRVYAAVTYKGRRYYVIAEQCDKVTGDPLRCRLATLDEGGPVFWADCPACELVKRYEGRERWDGRRYSGKTVTVYPTVGSLREFRDQQQQARASGEPVCAECGRAGGELVADLEDGQLKHPHCCDIAP
jgi:hypothetical protein